MKWRLFSVACLLVLLMPCALLAQGTAPGASAGRPDETGARHRDASQGEFLTVPERTWLAANRDELTVAFDPRWCVAPAVDVSDAYAGMEVDYIHLLEQKLGVTFRLVYFKTVEALNEALKHGEIDVLPAVRPSQEGAGRLLYTEPYMQIPIVLLVNQVMEEKLTIERMHQMRLAVGSKYGVDDFLATQYPRLKAIPTKTDMDALLDLALGNLDVVIMDLATARSIIQRESLTLLTIAGRIGPAYEFRMATRKEQPLLHSALDKALARITDDERRTIQERWTGTAAPPFYRSRVFWMWLSGGVVVVFLVLGMVLAWNRALQHQVDQRTHELTAEVAERRRAETALSRAHDDLEKRVEERTRELAQANVNLEHEVAERRQAESEVLEISSLERKRIGRDLHDSLGQQLAGISCLTELLSTRLSGRDDQEAGKASKVSSLISDAIAETRSIVRGLMPVEIVEEGLSHALLVLTRETSETAGIDCRFDGQEPTPVYDNDVATNLYRIAQEAVSNAARHGKAGSIIVRLDVKDYSGSLEVVDDGCGMTDEEEAAGSGMGMRTMRYRAEMIGGRLEVTTGKGQGTSIRCSFQDKPSHRR